MTLCVWATNTDFFFPINKFFFVFLETNMFHTMVCVTCVRIICVAVTFVLLFLLNFILKSKTKQNKNQAPVTCTSS